VFLFQYQMIAG